MVINYIGYKEHVLHTKGDLGELQLGDIVLIEESNKLDEVVVTGRQITRTTDKVLYFPSKEQLRHASDGYKALALMMIPTLDVDPFTKKVSTIQGETLLLINGREASSDEIRNLNPKDILRIDFYDQHALHERLNYEALKEKYYNQTMTKKQLLIPEVFELSLTEKNILFNNIALLHLPFDKLIG